MSTQCDGITSVPLFAEPRPVAIGYFANNLGIIYLTALHARACLFSMISCLHLYIYIQVRSVRGVPACLPRVYVHVFGS